MYVGDVQAMMSRHLPGSSLDMMRWVYTNLNTRMCIHLKCMRDIYIYTYMIGDKVKTPAVSSLKRMSWVYTNSRTRIFIL